ncbi:hypothetical protein [Mesorhizobium carmichaelinearum]|uniref:hypothetical protein n=1 Tax=Mesorhizobium carmichaelinearum TaxID=1208188 RepID=UPI000BA2C2E5|nr:hypothetical protein [Mesorhizobium carmichaelinearum]
MINASAKHEDDSLLRRQTDPVWLQDHYLGTGHTEETNSATFTFIKRHGRIYAVTCGHVVDQLSNPESVPDARLPTLALQIDRGVLNLSQVTGIGRITQTTRAAEKNETHRESDIAIAPLSESYWSILTEKKNKTAIDLDAWREPRWESVKMCVAAGYPNEHKEQLEVDGRDMVGAGFMRAIAAVSSTFGRDQKFITLSSVLDEPHGHFFSGMSGGPVYAAEGDEDRPIEDEELFPVGIIFEGYPSSGRGERRLARTRRLLS